MKKPMVFEGVVATLIIILLFAMYLMVTGSRTVETNEWDVVANGPYQNLQIGEDGTLYAFMGTTGNTVYAIDSNGNIKWKLQVPGQWRVANPFNKPDISHDDGSWWSWSTDIKPLFSTDNGTMYLYLRENRSTQWSHYPSDDYLPKLNETPLKEKIIAISPVGAILWNRSIGTDHDIYSDVNVKAANDKIYLFDDYNLTVLNSSGSVLFTIPNVSDPPAIDEEGRIYIVSSTSPSWASDIYPTTGYLMPSDALRAYNSDGTLWWQENISQPAWRQDLAESVKQQYGTLPIYQNQTLYVPVKNGIIALYTNGSYKWQKVYDWSVDCKLLRSMPLDSHDSVYLSVSRFHESPHLEILNGTGLDVVKNESFPIDYFTMNDYANGNLYNGNLYFINFTMNGFNQSGCSIGLVGSQQYIGRNLSDLYPNVRSTNDMTFWHTINARLDVYNLLDDNTRWSTRIPISGTNTVIIDNNNAVKYLPPGQIVNVETSNTIYQNQHDQIPPSSIEIDMEANILPGRDITYLSLYTAISDVPIRYSKSAWTYSSRLYAFNNNGTLIWEKPTDYYVSSMTANNSTVFFNTADGKFNMATINGIAGGITLLALIYVFVRFFMAGFVVRAKDRLDKNENRNRVLRFIVDNPGSTMFEISRGIGLNVGTVRYHVFILGQNHRVVSYEADDKHVRYFTNSGAYSKEEQLVISLMRRDSMGKIIALLVDKPGLTNIEISSVLGIQESAVSRCMKELSEKGVVARPPGGLKYSIKNDYLNAVTRASDL